MCNGYVCMHALRHKYYYMLFICINVHEFSSTYCEIRIFSRSILLTGCGRYDRDYAEYVCVCFVYLCLYAHLFQFALYSATFISFHV